ncbi:MAG: glycosyltransferase family 9 protein [Ignavibacteria bacterium]
MYGIDLNKKYLLFRVTWVVLILSIMCDIQIVEGLQIFYFNLKILSSSLGLILYLVVFFLIVSPKQIVEILRNYEKKKILILLAFFLAAGFISGIFSEFRVFVISTLIFRYLLFLIALIATIVYVKIFNGTNKFLINSFIAINLFLILTSLLDFYFPPVNRFLMTYMGHMKLEDSNLKVGTIVYLRPAGVLTETNLSAFSIALANVLLLLNADNFRKRYIVYGYYLISGFIFGMLGSRSALIFLIFIAVFFILYKIVRWQDVLAFCALFFLAQLLTPQTHARINQIFNQQYVAEEEKTGRLTIWYASFEAFKTSPIIGIGTDVFFRESPKYLNIVVYKISNLDRGEILSIKNKPNVNSHSLIMSVLTENGLIGLSLLILIFYYLFRDYIKNKKTVSLLLFTGLIFVSVLSGYAPYYKYYLLLCIYFYVLADRNKFQYTGHEKNEIKKSNVKKILIFKLCCFGDIVQITPVINNLKLNFPESKIAIVAASWIEKLLPHIDNIDEAIIFDSAYDKNLFRRITKTANLIIKLRKEKFDLAFLGHRKSIFGFILDLSGIKYRLGFSKTRFLTHTVPFEHNIHTVTRQIKILDSAGLKIFDTKLELKRPGITIPDNNNSKFRIGIFPFGGSNPGTSMDIKRWDAEKYRELLSMVAGKYPDMEVIVFEGSGENEKMESFEFPNNVRKMTIDIDLISTCSLFISGDTGPLYIAEGLNVSTLSLFGPTDPGLYAPRNIYDRVVHKYLWKNPSCSPCYTTITAVRTGDKKYWRDKTFICNTGTHECLNELSIKEVFDAVENILQELNPQTL